MQPTHYVSFGRVGVAARISRDGGSLVAVGTGPFFRDGTVIATREIALRGQAPHPWRSRVEDASRIERVRPWAAGAVLPRPPESLRKLVRYLTVEDGRTRLAGRWATWNPQRHVWEEGPEMLWEPDAPCWRFGDCERIRRGRA